MTVVDSENESVNPSDNEHLADILDARLTRRGVLGGALGAAAAAVAAGTLIGGAEVLAEAQPAAAGPARPLLGFSSIPVSSLDTVTVPPGYTARVLIGWGDPISDGPAFKQDASNTAADQAQQWGMHNDGIVYFPSSRLPQLLNGYPLLRETFGPLVSGIFGSIFRTSERGVICQNNEYADEVLLFTDGTANWSLEKSNKLLNAHGVSIIEVEKQGKQWKVVRPSKLARRITGQTPMKFAGPAAGHELLRTSYDPEARKPLGTLNNCAMGYTPWGTYLTCEENFNSYFRRPASGLPANDLEARYGVGSSGNGALLAQNLDRFDLAKERNEPNRFGWVVEIDPFSPKSTPVKRTALGRIKHEGAWVQVARDGRVVVYSGDDQVNEYIYRFVSRLPWRQSMAKRIHPLDDGTLYVAKFDAGGTGVWLPLTPENPALKGWTIGDILINTRTAADLVGATKMDRPEWIDTIPKTLSALCTLTNNTTRGKTTAPAGPPVDEPNPRANNVYGQIIRWTYEHDFSEPTFTWDLFAVAGDPAVETHPDKIMGDKYGSPDGIYVAPSGRIWIQTDVSGSTIGTGAYAGFGNNQMLCADPVTKETRRFLVGPNVSEITGVFATPDEKTLFVGIQHPGEAPSGSNDPTNPKKHSSWPDGASGGRPRSSLIYITKDDGGPVGS